MPNEVSMDDYAAQREAQMQPAPAPEAPAIEPAAPSAQEAAIPGTAEPQDPALDPAAAQPQQTESPQHVEQRRARGVQKRIDELTRRAAESDRRADMLLEANRELVARVTRGEQPANPQQRPQAPEQADARPREEDYPGDYRAFLRAEAQWEARQVTQQALQQERDARERETQQQREQEQARQQLAQVETVLTDFGKRVNEYAKQAPDYIEATHALDHIEIGPHNAPMVQTILLRPDNAKILHHLSMNPGEAERISALPPVLQGAAIGEFAASINRAPRPSTAPAPGRAVSGMRPPNSGAPASSSMDDYAAWRSRQARA